jgi:carbon-monoxide dehydrogenase medium subunit
MKPAPFAYAAPETLPEALETLARYGADARVLAGGQSLLAMMNLRQCAPTHLIDINRIAALGGIAPTPGALVLGATARMVDVENDPLVRRDYRFIVDALKLVATPPIRNRGTVVGSLAHGDPCAELPAVALCADAVLVLQSAAGGVREIAARTFYRGRFATRAAADEVIVALRVPRLPPRSGFAIVETSRRYNGVAVAGAVARVTVVDSVIRAATVVLFGVADTPVLCAAADGFVGLPAGDEQSIAAAAAATTRGLSPVSDVLADAAYRLHAATVLVRRAVAQALAGCPREDA